jgi:beta-glucanase (GH16 family)
MHTYVAEWEPGVIRWFVDGRLTYTRDSRTTPWLESAFSKPFYLRVNLAVGGDWPGSPDAATTLPADYEVDYVRVYQR